MISIVIGFLVLVVILSFIRHDVDFMDANQTDKIRKAIKVGANLGMSGCALMTLAVIGIASVFM